MNNLYNESGITIRQLKEFIKDWPEVDPDTDKELTLLIEHTNREGQPSLAKGITRHKSGGIEFNSTPGYAMINTVLMLKMFVVDQLQRLSIAIDNIVASTTTDSVYIYTRLGMIRLSDHSSKTKFALKIMVPTHENYVISRVEYLKTL